MRILKKFSIRVNVLRYCIVIGLALSVTHLAYAQKNTITPENPGIYLLHFKSQQKPEGLVVDARYRLKLSKTLVDTINRSVPLFFTTSFSLSRTRWYLLSQEEVFVKKTFKINYMPFLQEYRVYSDGLYIRFNDIDSAMSFIGNLKNWVVIEKQSSGKMPLSQGRYSGKIKMFLDTSLMPQPFQVHALNSTEWGLSSDEYRFTYVVEN